MKCPHCNVQIDDDCKFCPNCGNEIIRERICPKCGQVNLPTSTFCKSCGQRLIEKQEPKQAEEKPEEIKKPEKPQKDAKEKKKVVGFIFSIISMSFMLLSFVLLLAGVFSPLLTDSFFPSNEFTIISFVSNNIKGATSLMASYLFVPFVNSIILLLLLVTISILSIVFIGISIPKFVLAIKNKTHFDFSKRVIILYVLFIATVVYATNLCFNINGEMATIYNPWIIFILVVIAFFLALNIFVKEFLNEKHDLFAIIFRGSVRFFVFLFAIIAIFNIGGSTYSISATIQKGNPPETRNVSTTMDTGYMGIANYLIINAPNILEAAKDVVIASIVELAIGFLLSVILILNYVFLITKPLGSLDKHSRNIIGIILSTLASFISAGLLIVNIIAKEQVNVLNSLEDYRIAIGSTLHNDATIVVLVFSILLTLLFIGSLIVDKTVIERKQKQ